MRLFTGIDLPEDIRERLERLLMHLRPAAHLKWSAVYNLHLTLKFIGEWPEEKLPQLEAALALHASAPPDHGRSKRAGLVSESTSSARLLGWGAGGRGLTTLVRDTEAALAPLGIAKEDRAFSAHLTLARIKDPVPLQTSAKRDRAVGIDGIWFIPRGPLSPLPQPARLGWIHLHQAVGFPFQTP